MADLGWFTRTGLGLFVHWDHASQNGLEISWPLVTGDPRGLPIMSAPGEPEDTVTVERYHASAATFNPANWEPRELARLAREAGARYLVFTTRHHAGFSMFHTAASTFSVEYTPYGRDVTRELADAVRAEGLRVGFYYSLSDWHHPDYPRFEQTDRPYDQHNCPRPSAEEWSRYRDYLRSQLTELLTGYGRIDLLWFDGEWERTANEWGTAELRELVRSLQPNTIVNDRLLGQGDYATPEQGLPTATPDGPWEMCMTIGDLWAASPHDTNYKSARRLAMYLIEVTSRGGNLLLNIGLQGDGSPPTQQVERLRSLGAWVASHGESVLGARPCDPRIQFYGPLSCRGSRLYLHLVALPVESVFVRGVPVRRLRDVTLLGTGQPLPFSVTVEEHERDRSGMDALGEVVIDAPAPTGALIDVIAIDFDEVDGWALSPGGNA